MLNTQRQICQICQKSQICQNDKNAKNVDCLVQHAKYATRPSGYLRNAKNTKSAECYIQQHANMPNCKFANMVTCQNSEMSKDKTCPNANMPKHNHVKTQISQMQSYQIANKQMQTRQTAYLPQCFPTMQICPKSTCQHENMPKCQIKACKNSIYSKL